ncbi:MAG: ATP-binding protein [Chloroflexota bacterium]
MTGLIKNSVVPFNDSQAHLLAGLAVVDLRVQWAVARARANGLDPSDEFRGLYISDEQVDGLLQQGMGQHGWSMANGQSAASNGQSWSWAEQISQARTEWQAQTRLSREKGLVLRLDEMTQAFALTTEETEAFLLVLAPELDPRYAQLYAYLQDDVTRKRPSIDLILNLLTDSFSHKLRLRRLFGPNGRLTQSRLLRVDEDDKEFLAQTIRPYAHIVAYLLEDEQIDPKLTGAAHLLPQPDRSPINLPPPARVPADFLARLVQVNTIPEDNDRPPFFIFQGGYGSGRQEAAQQLAQANGQPLLLVDLQTMTQPNENTAELIECVLRDGRLHQATLYLTHWASLLEDGRLPHPILAGLMAYPHTIIAASEVNWQPAGRPYPRRVFAVSFAAPDFNGRLHIWHTHLGGDTTLDLTAVATHFRFSPGQIEDAIATAHDLAHWQGEPLSTDHLFTASRRHSNQNLAALAAKIQPRYAWADIVLPSDTRSQLQEMVNMVRQRPTVYGDWGFDRKLALGKGLSALFAGESGTGKTMSADIMAGELGLDLYKVDLSLLVSKYIGETEKNLDRIFTEAATSNAILFFDEADAIFGKRSEVKDSHDRYANIEISYLLQRMEAYDGVVILATNLRANLDEAFTRRLHFAIEFPFPEAADRERIWQVNFPPETPLAPDLDFTLLAARYPITGGNIRNIILAAAFLAAEGQQPVSMAHLLHATRREYQKIGRLVEDRLFTLPERR